MGLTHVPCGGLRDIVHLELPAAGTDVLAGEPVGLVESATGVHELLAPVAGIVVGTNPALEENPEIVTDDPYGAGWLLAVRPADPGELSGLLDRDAYEALAAEEA